VVHVGLSVVGLSVWSMWVCGFGRPACLSVTVCGPCGSVAAVGLSMCLGNALLLHEQPASQALTTTITSTEHSFDDCNSVIGLFVTAVDACLL